VVTVVGMTVVQGSAVVGGVVVTVVGMTVVQGFVPQHSLSVQPLAAHTVASAPVFFTNFESAHS